MDNVIDRSSKVTAGPTAFLSSAHECQWLGVSSESRRVVDASTGKLTEVLEDFLVAIDLSGIGLSGSIPQELGNLRNLQDLCLYSNYISGRIMESLESLEDLSYVDLADNLLTGTMPLFREALTYIPHSFISTKTNLPAVLPRARSTSTISSGTYGFTTRTLGWFG